MTLLELLSLLTHLDEHPPKRDAPKNKVLTASVIIFLLPYYHPPKYLIMM